MSKPKKPREVILRIRSYTFRPQLTVWLLLGRAGQQCLFWSDDIMPDIAEELVLSLGAAVTVEREASPFTGEEMPSLPRAAQGSLFG